MAFRILISLICFLVVICLRIKTAQADCYDIRNFTVYSTYSKNRDTIIASLASNAAANDGFYSSSVGQGSDTVYATAMCSGDADSTQCSSCVNTSAYNLLTNCPFQYEAVSWDGQPLCVVYYANRYLFGVREMDPVQIQYDTGTISWDSSEPFYGTLGGLVENLKNEAIHGSSKLKYAAGKKNFTLKRYIYAQVQCTPDLSKSDCDECLAQNIADYATYCSGHIGGFVRRPSCTYRWDMYPFYTDIVDNAPPPSISPALAPPSPPTGNGGVSGKIIAIIVSSSILSIALVIVGIFIFRYQRKRKVKRIQHIQFGEDVSSSSEFSYLDFRTIRVATDNFSDDKKLGQGGFGTVYKGILPNGQEIAVKRLARNSIQGELEFKNEVKLMSKLQHRNLVILIGFSIEKEERVLVYEFSSLDHYIFDQRKRCLLDWTRRYQIISGIAKGLLYLHEDSQLRIIHRDLKPSNILIDEEMNSKIADFGMARLFAYDQTQDNTSKIAGTYGYMAPQYVWHGQFSAKSDVFSFGVLLLEIISGQRNMHFENGELIENLVTKAWRIWDEGNALNLIDPILRPGSESVMLKCIHIALLCVQTNASDRPNIASVVLMLRTKSLPLSAPLKPGYFMQSFQSQSESDKGSSTNGVTISDLYPR